MRSKPIPQVVRCDNVPSVTDPPERGEATDYGVPRSVVVAVVALDAVPDWDRVTGMLAPGNHESPSFRHRVVDVPFGLEPPRWSGGPDSDPPWQLDRVSLTTPATFADVLDSARTTPPVPGLRHPLWRMTLFDGLTGGGSALVIRLHHLAPPGDDPGDVVRSWARSAARGLTRVTTSLVNSLLGGPDGETDPVRAPERSASRLHAVDVPFADLRAAADRAGCGLESAFVAAMLLASAAYRRRHGRDTDGLRAAMAGSGHALSTASAEGTEDPDELMRRIETRRAGPAEVSGSRPVDLRAQRGEPVAALAKDETLFGPQDVFTATLPGSNAPMYIGGAKVERYYGFGPTHGAAFNATLMSYRSGCWIGVTVDADAVPDREVFDDCLRSGISAVLGATEDPDADEITVQSG